MQDLPIGITIIDLDKDFKVVGHNKAVTDMILENHYADLPKECVNTALKEALVKLYVKPVISDEQKDDPQLAAQIPFSEFVAYPYKNSHGFLELPDENSVELKIKRGIYEDQDVLFVTLIDCSLARRLEKAKTENRCKTLIMSTVSHELRTPINAVLGSLETISQYIPPEGQAYVELAKNSCHMLSYQINDLTDYGKITDSKLVLSKSKVDLEATSKECISLVNWQAKGKTLKVEFVRDPTAPRFIWTNERRLKQVLLNLLTNAIKFTQKGGVRVKVKSTKEQVEISVKDTGVGIKEQDLSKLFKEFQMLETHRSMNPNGTGLGLYLSRKLVNEMQGDITVKSVFNKGTQFTVCLPIDNNAVSLESPAEGVSRNTAEVLIQIEEAKECQCIKVLAVDDNDTNLLVIRELLKRYKMECDIAKNGLEAVKAVEAKKEASGCCNTYRLILMDCNMPEMNGFEAARKIRELGTEICIIALTGENKDDVVDYTKDLFQDVLCKPISLKKVGEMLKKYGVISK